MLRIGVDLGGTKIEALALGGDGRALLRRRVGTPAGDYAATLGAIAGLVAAIEMELGETARVGVGAPGSVSTATGLVRNANSTVLNGKPLVADLGRALGREVRVANDANCFALSEAIDGAGAGFASVFGVILGTGVGGGIVDAGVLRLGANAIAGEWGHNPLPWRGEGELAETQCWCGRRRCIESYLAGPGLAADHARHGGAAGLDARRITALADAGDPLARATLARHADRLAAALAAVINVLDPDVIVLGGGLSNIATLPEAVAARLAPHVFSDRCTTRVVRNLHGDSSGVRGAAWLWPG